LGVLLSVTVHAEEKPVPFEPSWDSLSKYQVPEWYKDAKFGIFIHWGVYSVPAFGNEWYPRTMYKKGQPEFKHHVDTFGPQSRFGYKDFIPQFRAEKFDPADWADLFSRAGAKYVVPVAEHHDGFAMYDSALTEWNAAKMGPKRDIIGELAKTVREKGMVFGLSSHRAEHWWFYGEGMTFDSDVREGKWNSLYGPAKTEKDIPDQAFLDDWLARCKELTDKYQPQVFWFDWWIEQPAFTPYLQQFASHYYNRGIEWNKGVAINYKNKTFPETAAVLDIERGKLGDIREPFWQTDTSVGIRSWGYVEKDRFRTVSSLIHELVDIVSKNGCMLLNIGPRPDGTIPDNARSILLGMGDWLRLNGEAVYGTRPWTKAAEGPTAVKSGSFSDHAEKPFTAQDFRFTRKGNVLYAICLGWPEDNVFKVASLGSKASPGIQIQNIELLGAASPVKWHQKKRFLRVDRPEKAPCENAYVLKITTTGL
jgi:alpha-L-fucosidase